MVQNGLNVPDYMVQLVFIEVSLREMAVEIRKVFLRIAVSFALFVIVTSRFLRHLQVLLSPFDQMAQAFMAITTAFIPSVILVCRRSD
jgi:hypothetical protein